MKVAYRAKNETTTIRGGRYFSKTFSCRRTGRSSEIQGQLTTHFYPLELPDRVSFIGSAG